MMSIIKIVIFFFISNTLFAIEYKIEMYFTTNLVTMDLSNNNKYHHATAPAVWKDSNGDYGNLMCYRRIISSTNIGIELDLFCSAKNQDNNKFWFRMRRDSREMDTGIGISSYLDVTGKYKNFKGIQCKYAAKLFEANSIVNKKCDVNNFND